MESLVFDLEPVRIAVKVGGKDYVLKEADEGVSRKFQNGMFKKTRLNSDGKPSTFEGLADSQAYLVALCLIEVIDGKEFPVTEELICTWPSRVVKALYVKAVEISDLRGGEDSAKKPQPGSGTTSA